MQELVNTRDLEHGTDLLADEAGLRAWLLHRNLIGRDDEVTRRHVAQAIELREAIRALLLARASGSADAEAAAAFRRVARGAPIVASVDGGGTPVLLAEKDGVAGAFGTLCAIVATAETDGTWRRLKACVSETCHGAFYDRSKNNSSRWCSMDLCGTPAKMRRYRARAAEARRRD